MKSSLLVKKLLELVEMTSGLVNVSFSLPEWQSEKNDFLCPLREFKLHVYGKRQRADSS